MTVKLWCAPPLRICLAVRVGTFISSVIFLFALSLWLRWQTPVHAASLQATTCQLPALQKTGAIPGQSEEVLVADFNRDGRQDVVLLSGQQTFLGDGLGGFTLTSSANGYLWRRGDQIQVGDFTGDGFPDLYVRASTAGSTTLQVWINDGQGRFAAGTTITANVLSFVIGDVNNDGLQDVVVNIGGNYSVYLANTNRTLTRLPDVFGSGGTVSLLDVNGDGRLDFVNALDAFSGTTPAFIWFGNGDGTFRQVDFVSIPAAAVRLDRVADLNRDGRPDLIARSLCGNISSNSMDLFLLLNNGRGNFSSDRLTVNGTDCSRNQTIKFVQDITGDGYPDIALTDGRFALNNGQGGICSVTTACCLSLASTTTLLYAVADFDGDNRADVITQESFTNFALWSAKSAGQNTPPTITAGESVTLRQGYQDRFTSTLYRLANVNDAETPIGNLQIAVSNVPTGVTIFNVQNQGNVIAQVDVGCNAPVGEHPITITVTDGGGLSASTAWLLRISEKVPPRFTYAPVALSVAAGATLEFVAPAAVDASNVPITLTPANISSSTFQGQIDAFGSTGNWRIVNAAPVGTHTLTFTVIDRCGLQAVSTAVLTVTGTAANTPPRVVPASPTTTPQGSTNVEIVLATLSDAETPAGNLSYDVTPLPGLQINNIRNDNGVLKGTPVIGCITPAVVYQINIRATDAGGLSATGTFNLTAGQNTAPEIGAYPATTSIARNGSATLTPSALIRDNGTATATVSAPTFTGNLRVNAEGVVTINQAAPVGTHSVAVMVTDNCGLVTRRNFTIVVTEPTGGGCDVPAFGAANNVDANARPYGLTSGDFNGDGRMDLATTNLWDNTVTVLLTGANGFTKQPAIAVGVLPNFIVARDLNGDGRLDLTVVNRGSDTVTILLGNGDGTFTKKGDYPVGNKSTGVAIGDFNSDGKLDLILPNDGLGNAAILDGNGDGSFASLRFVFAGTSPQPPVVADFNRDGRADVAFPNYLSGEVAILLGQGNGTFQSPIYIGNLGGPGVEAIAAGDVNGDGNVDIAVTNTTTHQVHLIFGNGAGGFTNGGGFATFSDYPASIVIADFTGDGKADIAVSGYNNGKAHIFRGLGNGFDNNAPLVMTVGEHPLWLLTNDFNGDGKPDLAVANNGSGTVSVLLNGCSR